MKTKLLLFLLLLSLITKAQTNLVLNGGFETWSNSTPTNWTITNKITQNTTNSIQGFSSAMLSITDKTLAPEILTQVPMEAGVTYTVKFKYKYVNSNYSGSHPISLNISKDGASKTLSSSSFAINNNWTLKEETFIADKTLSYDLIIGTYSFDNENFSVLIDDVQVYIEGTEQYTLIPDVNFENKLISFGLDDVADGKVLTSNINTLTTLNVSNSNITNLVGIQDFVALTDLNCYSNELSSLDVTKNKALTYLNCGKNKFTSLDVSLNVLLKTLYCGENQISTLDVTKNIVLESLDVSFYNTINGGTLKGNIKAIDLSKNLELKYFSCGSQKIESLDFSNNTKLTNIQCYKNSLTNLNVSNCTILERLNCSTNKLINLDVTSNIGLYDFSCSSNNLTTIDLSKNVNMLWLDVYSNQLKAIDVSNNLNLLSLEFFGNQLTTLDVSKNIKLETLIGNVNLLTTLDVSKNNALIRFGCASNKLTSLNLKNGANTLLNKNNIILTGNPNLSCIVVDDIAYANANWTDIKDINTYFSPYDCGAITQISDPAFEDKLIALQIDKDGKNGIILNSSIASIASLDVSNSSITNLNGIQGFTALTTLDASNNLLETIDLSKNNALTTLNCSNNPMLTCIQVADIAYATNNWATTKDAIANFNLDCTSYTNIPDANFEAKLIALGIDSGIIDGRVVTANLKTVRSLDVSNSTIADLTGIQDFTALTSLNCSSNQLKSLDLTKITSLIYLYCSFNKLSSLNVTKNINLTNLDCNSNEIIMLDISANTKLRILSSGNNHLTDLNLETNTLLEYLDCSYNNLKELNLNKNSALIGILCYNNNFENLDLSKQSALLGIDCSNNQLTSLNLKNGTNTTLLNQFTFWLRNNSSRRSNTNFKGNIILSCILVDDVDYTNTNWSSYKDAAAVYSSDPCPIYVPIYTLIPDTKFEAKLIALGIDDSADGKVLTYKINTLTSLNVSNSSITDLTGIQDFLSLTTLYCSENALTSLDVTKNTALTYLDCSTNSITTLDISKNTGLTELYCNANKLTSLDVSNNLVLNKLNVSDNLLTTLDVSKNTSLTEIKCSSNSLASLNLKNGNNANMKRMYFANLAQNPDLKCIQVDNAAYCNDNWEAKDATAGYSSDCSALANTYTTIPDSNFEDKLIALGIDKDGKNNKVLTSSIFNVATLDVSNSGIADLTGIEDFKMLTSLTCRNNAITALDVSKNQSLDKLYCSTNKISNLDLTLNTALTVLSCSFNLLTTLDVSANKSLTQLDCAGNSLTYLNIQNGNNVNMQSMFFGNFTENPKLTCILVDDATYAIDKWGLAKDAAATYSTDCSKLGTEVTVFDKVAVYPNPTKGELHIDNVVLEKATVYDALGKLVKTATFASGANNNTIHLTGLPNGIYYMYLQSEGASTAKKIIVE